MKMKQILGMVGVATVVFFMWTSIASAVPYCSSMPTEVKNAWGTLSVDAQNSYMSAYCPASAGSTGSSGSTSGGSVSGGTQLVNPIKVDTFSALVALVIDTAVNILIPFIVLAFIYSGFLFVKAQGKEKELEEAKKAIYWSVIGAFILFGAAGFAALLSQTLSTVTK